MLGNLQVCGSLKDVITAPLASHLLVNLLYPLTIVRESRLLELETNIRNVGMIYIPTLGGGCTLHSCQDLG